VVCGQEYKSLMKWSNLMPINVTFPDSGKISLQIFILKILVFTLAASRLNSKVYLFSFGLHGLYSPPTSQTKNSKLNV